MRSKFTCVCGISDRKKQEIEKFKKSPTRTIFTMMKGNDRKVGFLVALLEFAFNEECVEVGLVIT